MALGKGFLVSLQWGSYRFFFRFRFFFVSGNLSSSRPFPELPSGSGEGVFLELVMKEIWHFLFFLPLAIDGVVTSPNLPPLPSSSSLEFPSGSGGRVFC